MKGFPDFLSLLVAVLVVVLMLEERMLTLMLPSPSLSLHYNGSDAHLRVPLILSHFSGVEMV